jgi:Zn-dependent oligopeptidase
MPKRRFIIIILLFCATVTNAQNLSNPLLIHTNEPIRFDKVNAAVIREAVLAILKISEERIRNITAVSGGAQNDSNTLLAVDELFYEINDLSMKLTLIGGTYSDDSTRNAANDALEKLSLYYANLFLNEPLYKSLKLYSTLPGVKELPDNHKKFLNETIIAFEKNGMKLDSNGRKQLKAINEKIIAFGTQFDKNIAESKDSVAFTEQELAGVPGNTKDPWKRGEGKYIVYANPPNYVSIMTYADNDATRRNMYMHYNNRAYPQNIKVLDSLFYYRRQLAKTLGFKSYAAYVLVDKMAAKPETVWNFENNLISRLTPNVIEERSEYLQVKRQLQPGSADTLYDWDLAYYKKKLLDRKYQLNTDEVKEYFEMNNTIQGMFRVYQKLLNIEIKEVSNVPVWVEKVKTYEMYKNGKKIGSFYLDLYPRLNKFTHFACFPISQYRFGNGNEIYPVAALVCNFPEGSTSEPSLLPHQDVIILFHEFGHLVHDMLGRSDIASQGPFSVKGDFAEAPSQFLENWCWEYESLKLFAKNYKTGEVLPESLFKKMKSAQLVGVAAQYIRQVYLGVLDFTYEDKYDSIQGQDLVQVSKNLHVIRQMPFAEGSHFIASFGHLNSYAANYYGYLWSKVYAEDMFSVFKKNGVMDTNTGIRYRRAILEKASTKQEMDMLRDFLGREPNSDAFLASLGIR